ncbi:MAG: hypothetical protein LW832_01635 [Parachlamydia sp.]|jgi:hypothetical protein|nr:hypothetical protein [Parachlamydia sp.]
MKFALAKEHIDYFAKTGAIAFDDLLSAEQTENFHQLIKASLAERLHKSDSQLKKLPSDPLFLEGRDLWRVNEALRKMVCQLRFAEIAAELAQKKPLRLGYTQYFPSFNEDPYGENKGIYRQFLQKNANLKTISCVENVLCGLLFSFGHPQSNEEGGEVFFNGNGRAVYLNPEKEIPWPVLMETPGADHFLIVYTEFYSHYLLEHNDPHTHFLKQLGYIFNEKLNDRYHPIVCR